MQILQADPLLEPSAPKFEETSRRVQRCRVLAADLAEESQEAKMGKDNSQHKYEALMADHSLNSSFFATFFG